MSANSVPVDLLITRVAEDIGATLDLSAALATPDASFVQPDVPLARLIDHTLLKPEATADHITRLCAEAQEYRFASVCVNAAYIALVAQLLQDTPEVAACATIGFPLGATLPEVKAYESSRCIALGATEVDMVINVGALKAKAWKSVYDDIAGVVDAAHAGNALCKVILETCLLTDEEKIAACLISKQAGADFVKTSTGFSSGGATTQDVALMRRVVGPEMGVKASGGIRTYADAQAMIVAGATRIGASAGVRIVREARGETVDPPQKGY